MGGNIDISKLYKEMFRLSNERVMQGPVINLIARVCEGTLCSLDTI